MLLRKFSWLYRCANWRCREFFAAENIKDIKSFRAKKFGFNISGKSTQVVCCPKKPVWLGANCGWNDAVCVLLGVNYALNDAVCAPRRGNLRIAQGRAKRRPGWWIQWAVLSPCKGKSIYNRCNVWTNSKRWFLRFCPCRAKGGDGRQYPGRRFALPWAMRRLPLWGAPNYIPSQQ